MTFIYFLDSNNYKNLIFKFQNIIVNSNNIYNTDKKIINIIKEKLS